jgi:Sap-like sulfolipid-1-addressing protein
VAGALLEIFVLGAASMFWPVLLVIVVLALRTSHPLRILCSFWAGGMLTSVSVGAALVFALQGSPLMSGNEMPSAPWVDIVVGTLALVAALVLRRVGRRNAGRHARHERRERKRGSSEWIERLVERGGPLAFVAGIVATILPAPLAIIAMADIAQLGYSTGATLLVIVLFYVLMFTFVEVPIVAYVVSPEATAARVTTFEAWLTRNLVQLGVWALTIFGSVEIVRGIVTAVR